MTDHGLDLAVIGNGRTAALVDPVGAPGVVVLSALRQRSDLLPPARGRRGEGIFGCRARRHGRFSVGVSSQHRGGVDGSHRSPRRRGPHYRFCAPSSAIRPRVPAAAAHQDHRAGRRAAAHHHPLPPDPRLRASVRPPFRRQQSYPLPARRHRHPAHHRCAAVLYRARGPLHPHPAAASGLRRRRAVSRRSRNDLPRILRPHHRLLDGLVARSLHLLRLAGRDHPRRDHAEAQQLRGDRRHHRGPHHLDSRSAGLRTHLGLSLLLAARRVFRGEGAQPHRRDADHGGFHLLHLEHRVQSQRADAAGL